MAPTLEIMPLDDSPAHAAARREELDIPHDRARADARLLMEAVSSGSYRLPDGRRVAWGRAVEAAIAAKLSLPAEAALPDPGPPRFQATRILVRNATTLAAARELVRAGRRVAALNFANGVTPGGGFLRGARAQEESLCRASALYPTLYGDPMYEAHRARPTPDSTAWVILSPEVPVFRDDRGALEPEPWRLAFLTCAAPVAQRVGLARATELMGARIDRVFAVAAAHGFDALVLGAWGCGAFGNDPEAVAQLSRAALEGPFAGRFADVVFAVADWSPERRFLGPFARAFAA